MLGLLVACGADAPFESIERWTLRTDDGGARDVSLPAHLPIPDRDLTYTLAARVVLPEPLRDDALDLVLPALPAHVVAEVDDVRVVAPFDPTDGYRVRGPQTFRLPASATADGVVDLVLRVEHRWTQSAWIGAAPRLTLAGRADRATRAVGLTNLHVATASFTALFQVGFIYLLVFLVDRRRRAYLYFGVQAICASYYPLFVLGFPQLAFGRYDVSVLAVMLIVAPGASIYFLHAFFELGPPWRGWPWVLAAGATICVLFPQPFAATRVVAPVVVGTVVSILGYHVVRTLRLLREGRERASAAHWLLGWSALGATASIDFLVWLGGPDLLGGARPASLGLLVFAVSLTVVLGRRHITSLSRADALNEELGRRVVELETGTRRIESLNTELRRQIHERSSAIFEKLAASLPTAPRSLDVGEVVSGRYEVLRPLGEGGMGVVYEVRRLADSQRLALKLTHASDPVSLARLAREARIASRVHHENVVDVVDVDVSDSGLLYLVLELVEGPALRDFLRAPRGRFWSVSVLHQIACGLRALHAHGVVHRDLKPDNVLLTGDVFGVPSVKITDFGISRQLDLAELTGEVTQKLGAGETTPSARRVDRLAGGTLTEIGRLAGTPTYMAPELADGIRYADESIDVFALGVIAHELLLGRRPFVSAPILARLEGRSLPEAEPLRGSIELDDALLSLLER